MSTKEQVVFHVAQVITDDNGVTIMKANGSPRKDVPTHTLMFERLDDLLLMGWSVAHSGVDKDDPDMSRGVADQFDRKLGRKFASDKLQAIAGQVSKIAELEEIGNDVLPNVVLDSEFAFYLDRAAYHLFGDTYKDGVTLAFVASEGGDPLSIEIDFDEVVVEDTEDASDTNDYLGDSEFIFTVFTNEDDETTIVFQIKRDFIANGEKFDTSVSQEMVSGLIDIINEGEYNMFDEQSPVFTADDSVENVKAFLRSKGVAYSKDLKDSVQS